jgi:hypothetical protein
MAIKQHIYSDLDLRFLRQPVSGDVSFSYDEQAVTRSIKNLLSSKPYDRLWQPTLGSVIDNILFEPITQLNANLIKDEVVRIINNFEPRATIATIDVSAYPDQNGYSVNLFFYVGNNTSPTAINIILQRAR